MAAGNFLGTRADQQLRDRARRIEEQHIALHPDGEKEEIRQIFKDKGFSGQNLESAVDTITADNRRWVDTMIREEHGMTLDGPSPWRAASVTFAAFMGLGMIPLVTFFYCHFFPNGLANPYAWSTAFTGMAFFGIGALKGRFVTEPWYRSGIETLAVGSTVASLAYLVGLLLKGLLVV